MTNNEEMAASTDVMKSIEKALKNDPDFEQALRAEFERQHVGRDLTRHSLRGTYARANIAALWKQHIRTAFWMLYRMRRPNPAHGAPKPANYNPVA